MKAENFKCKNQLEWIRATATEEILSSTNTLSPGSLDGRKRYIAKKKNPVNKKKISKQQSLSEVKNVPY